MLDLHQLRPPSPWIISSTLSLPLTERPAYLVIRYSFYLRFKPGEERTTSTFDIFSTHPWIRQTNPRVHHPIILSINARSSSVAENMVYVCFLIVNLSSSYWNETCALVPNFSVHPDELVESTKKKLNDRGFFYANSNAGLGWTDRANREAFYRWRIIPRMLVDTNTRDLTSKFTSLPPGVLLMNGFITSDNIWTQNSRTNHVCAYRHQQVILSWGRTHTC